MTEHVDRTLAGSLAFNLTIVTGQGHHSARGPRIKQGVIELLISKGLEPLVDPTNPGVVRVTIRPGNACWGY